MNAIKSENKNVKPKRRFIKEAIMLTIVTLILRFAGTAFLIYISNKIGAEGIGLYQLTSSVYFLFVAFSTSGISLAVTRLVSEQVAVDNTYGARSAFHRAIMLSIILSIIASIILFFAAQDIGIGFLHDSRTVVSLKLLAFGLPFLSIASTIRGYFIGLKNGMKAISTDIVEQVIQIIVTVPLLMITVPLGLEAACCGLIIGAVASEIVSCIYSIILYLKEKSVITGSKIPKLNQKLMQIIVPVAVGYYVRSFLTTFENVLMPSGLKKFGQTGSDALAQYGMIKGMAMPILTFPSAILSAFASLLVPEVSAASSRNETKRINYIISKSIKATLLFSFLVTGIFIAYAPEIAMLFYNNATVGAMIFTLAPLVPLMYLDQIVDSILKGLNQQVSSMKYNTADSAMRVAIIFFLVPIFGVKGYIIMLYAGTIFNALLSINRLIVVSRVHFCMAQWVILPLVAIGISCIFVSVFLKMNAIVAILTVTLLYGILLQLFGCITKRDIAWALRIFNGKK